MQVSGPILFSLTIFGVAKLRIWHAVGKLSICMSACETSSANLVLSFCSAALSVFDDLFC